MSVVGFIRNYTWLCACGFFIVAMILATNGIRERKAWVTTEARVAGFEDSCYMVPQIPPNERQAVWGGVVPCSEVPAKKELHSAYTYDVTVTRTFVLEFPSTDGRILTARTQGADVQLPADAQLGQMLHIEHANANHDIIRRHEALRGLQIAILLNILGICVLAFAWLSHLAHGSQTTGAPNSDWLSKVDLPPESVAGLKTAVNARKAAAKLQARPARRAEPAPRQSAAKAGGFGRKG